MMQKGLVFMTPLRKTNFHCSVAFLKQALVKPKASLTSLEKTVVCFQGFLYPVKVDNAIWKSFSVTKIKHFLLPCLKVATLTLASNRN